MATIRKKRSWFGATIVAFVFTGALVALAVVSQEDGKIHIDRVAMPEQLQRCSTDTDCLLVDQISCCACEAGGGQGAINKRMRLHLKSFLEGACRKRVPCVDISACRDDLTPVCRDNVCTVITPRRT